MKLANLLLAVAVAALISSSLSAESLSSGTYALKGDDAHLTSGDWEVGTEIQPDDGVVIDGANWTAGTLVAFQGAAGKALHLRSGSLKILSAGHNSGVWPTSGLSWVNFEMGSTATLTVQVAPQNVYASCFASGKSFRYENDVVTQAEFESLFDVESAEPASGSSAASTIRLKASPAASDVVLAGVAIQSYGDDDTVKATVSCSQVGNPAAALYVAWDVEDKGRTLESWTHRFEMGAAAVGVNEETFEGVPERSRIVLRVFAVSGGQVAVSRAIWLYTRVYGGVTGAVNEWIAETEAQYSTPESWSLGHVPTAGEIRWFESGVVNYNNQDFHPQPEDVFIGGQIVNIKEFYPDHEGVVIDGTSFQCVIIAPRASFTVKSGAFEVTNSREHGFWHPGSEYCDIAANSPATFTFPISRSELKSIVTSNRFRYDGQAISGDDFDNPEHWNVVELSATMTRFSRVQAVEGAPSFGNIEAVVDPEDNTNVTVSVTIASNGASPVTSIVLKYGLSLTQLTEEKSFAFESVADGGTVSVELSDLLGKHRYYFAVVADNGISAESNPSSFITYIPAEGHSVWIGTIDRMASNPQNWLPSTSAPGAGTAVEVFGALAVGNLVEWDIAGQIASWTQVSQGAPAVRVDFTTTLQSPLVVTGDVTLDSGANWRVKTPSPEGVAPPYALNVEVGGNMTIGSGTFVQVGREYNLDDARASGYWNAGPGYVDIGGETAELHKLYGRGASFGGDGGYREELFAEAPAFVSYGSILNPLSWGSSGHGNGAQFAGAGIVRLVVGGTLVVNGSVEAVGFGYPNFNAGNSVGASSGGSINIMARAISGTGSITADGGCDQEGGNGSGGRIRIKLTGANSGFEGFDLSKITAYGGYRRDGAAHGPVAGVVDAAAGTVALQTASDGASSGVVKIANQVRLLNNEPVPVGATHFPSMQGGDARLTGVDLEIAEGTRVLLTRDCKIKSLTVNGTLLRSGTYRAAQLNEMFATSQFSGDGSLSTGQGLSVVVR